MKGVFFWNSRGLSDLAKSSFLEEMSKEHNLEFIALLETYKTLDQAPWEVGGILLGVNVEGLDLGSIEEGDFFVKFRLRNRKDDFKWVLVAV
jgi:hypothetical protein